MSHCYTEAKQQFATHTGQALRTLEGHSEAVTGGAVSASLDQTLKVWDLETGALIALFTCDAAVHSCAFTGDDKLIAGDARGRVHFLSLEEAKRKI